ncbi:MAG: ATP-binding protein [Magnetococcales bacterium]|nr:ATP-binding protein [Magnetococcales bacterium]
MPTAPLTDPSQEAFLAHLHYLKLPHVRSNFPALLKQATRENWSHFQLLERLIEGEVLQRQERSIRRLVQCARFPVIKTSDQFQWSWPAKINRLQVQELFRLTFLKDKANAIFLGGVGLGKTHLAITIGHEACLKGHSVLFTTAIDAINSLSAAQGGGRFRQELNRYLKPNLLILDELGYLPIDKTGADILFQIFSQRYERGSLILTSNRAYKNWPEIFNHDATLTSAILDRLLHHAETVVIEGNSFRMKERLDS